MLNAVAPPLRPPLCMCDDNVESDAPGRRFGHAHPLVCFEHGTITPQARKWLPTLPGRLFPFGVNGIARSGKSLMTNQKAEYHLCDYLAHFNGDVDAAARAANVPSLPADGSEIGKFIESNRMDPETRGINAMAIPRYREGSQEIDTDLLLDTEGLELGDTVDHDAILGIVSRIVTHITFVQADSFNHDAVRALGRLAASPLIVANRLPGEVAAVPWPRLHIVANKCSLQVPEGFIAQQLQDNPNDLPANNANRETVRRIWLQRERLKFSTVPLDPATNPQLAMAWSKLPPNVRAEFRAPFVNGIEQWCDASSEDTTAFTWTYAAAVEREHATDQQIVSGAQYAQLIDALVRAYAAARADERGRLLDPAGAVETLVRAAAIEADAAAVAMYHAHVLLAPHLLSVGANDVDGARGMENDGEAVNVLHNVLSRHVTLAGLCETAYASAVAAFRNLGPRIDSVLEASQVNLSQTLAHLRTNLEQHWHHQRAFNPSSTATEENVLMGPPYDKLHHVDDERKHRLGIIRRHHYWVKCVEHQRYERIKHVRNNGDVVYVTGWNLVSKWSEEITKPTKGSKFGPDQ